MYVVFCRKMRLAFLAVLVAAAFFVGQTMDSGHAQERLASQQINWKTVDVGGGVRRLQFYDSGLLAVSDAAVFQLDADNAGILSKLTVADVKFSDFYVSGDSLFLCGAYKVEYGFVVCISHSTIREVLALPTSKRSVRELSELATWSKTDFPGPLTCIAASSDTVCMGDEDGVLTALRATDGKPEWTASHHAKMITALAILQMPDDSTQVASGDWAGKIVVSDLETGRRRETFPQHRDTITALRTNPDAKGRLYSASRDGTLRLWYVHQSRLVRFVRQAHPVVALDDLGDGIVVGATRDSALLLVDTTSAEVVRTVPCSLDYIHAVATSNKRVAISDGRQHVSVATIVDR